MRTDEPGNAAPSAIAQRTSSYLQALKVPVLLLLVAMGLLAAYYSIYVREKQEYLTGRNLRLVASLGRQIETALDDHETVLRSFSNYYGSRNVAAGFDCARILSARSIPILDYVTVESAAPIAVRTSDACKAWDAGLQRSAETSSPIDAPQVLFEEGDGGLMWTRSRSGGKATESGAPTFRVALRDVLNRTMSDHALTGVFDAVVLATSSGRVIHQQDTSQLRLTSLNGLTVQQNDGAPKALEFSTLPMASQVVDVEVSGARYLLYVQPCCTGLVTATGGDADTSWVVAGLLDRRKFRTASMAVSFSAMALMAAGILLAIFSWPFVKLTLMGEGQRLRLVDVLLVGVCGILMTALVTLFAVDYFAYGALKDDVDGQLRALSSDIRASMKSEVQLAVEQLLALEKWADPSQSPDRVPALFTRIHQVSYPALESFALIDASGEQRWKWAVADFITPRISTRRRMYFRHWVEAHAKSPPYYLESIRSGTTGRKQAVLSMPTDKEDLAVAALTVPLMSLTEAVLPPGFGFAVIDEEGRVLFHSDVRHSLDEQLFLETDRERRLRAAAAARRDEVMNVRYFGRDHRAYIAPAEWPEGTRWSVVTFFDKELVRTINVEWLITALIFTVLYVAVYLVVCAGILLWRPSYRAPWIWPDPARQHAYRRLILSYVLFGIPFALAIYSFRDRYLLAVGWLLPFVVWVGTYLVLTRRDGPWRTKTVVTFGVGLVLSGCLFLALREEAERGLAIATVVLIAFVLPVSAVQAPVRRPYVVAACLLLVLTVVLPTIAFFKVAHAIQVESFIKHGQLSLARQLERRMEGATQEYERLRAQRRADVADRLRTLRNELTTYGGFFFDTRAWVEPAGEGACETPDAPEHVTHQDARSELPKPIEDLLPYYSEASVSMRELLHDRASDDAWAWHRSGSNLRMHSPASTEARDVGQMLCLNSTVPSVFATFTGPWPQTLERAIRMLLLALLPLATVAWIVRFVTRRIFLIDVVEPLAARKAPRPPMRLGAHVYLLWPAHTRRGAVAGEGTCVIDLAQQPAGVSVEEWMTSERDRLESLPPGSMIVLDHLEHGISDAAFNTRKLALINEALDMSYRTVVLVAEWTPRSLCRRMAAAAGAGDAATVSSLWAVTLARFTVIEGALLAGSAAPVAEAAATAAASAAAPDPVASRVAASANQRQVLIRAPIDPEEDDPVVRHVWSEVRTAAQTLEPDTTLDREQLYEEVGDRLAPYYQGIWNNCSGAERIVLQQLAQEGLLNEKNRQTIRALLGRGLIRKSPNFHLFSESFRRFALSRTICAQVAVLEEQTGSTWDAIRLPFLIALLGTSAFFFLTQRELFTTTMAVVTALAGGIPALVRLAGLFERRPAGGGTDG